MGIYAAVIKARDQTGEKASKKRTRKWAGKLMPCCLHGDKAIVLTDQKVRNLL